MKNRSHRNSGHHMLNAMKRDGLTHQSHIDYTTPQTTEHALVIEDIVTALPSIPDASIQLMIIDPPYNIEMATWDTFHDYISWAKRWLHELLRILDDRGNCVIFGGFQFQNSHSGDLLELVHYLRHHTDLRLINVIIWYYKNGMSAHRFFANRHEEVVWFAKTKSYYFDLDAVRIPFDEATKQIYSKDKRLNPASIEKGKNPTNVWEIPRLNSNAKERVGHPTQKPVELIRRLIRSLSYPGSLVLDCFAGSGVTSRVCIEEKRHSLLIDNDPQSKDFLEAHFNQLESSVRSTSNLHINPDLGNWVAHLKEKSS